MTYPARTLLEEVGYVALHFHWPLGEILDLEHPTRTHFVELIGDFVTRSGEE